MKTTGLYTVSATVVSLACLFTGYAVFAAESSLPSGASPDWLEMGIGLFGGLALFLFGMEQMAEGLKAAAGDRLRYLLGKLTTNRFAGVLTGAGVTAIIQSSSVTSVLVVGFVSAGLMTLPQSIGVIMGANIGTTVTAQIVAFKVSKAALPMITLGFAMVFVGKRETVQRYGAILFGLGLVFFGMNIMGDAMKPLRTYQPFLDLMAAMENPLLGIVVAAGFTALVQSSSATTGIVIVMATQGFVTLEAGIAMALGANIGTCVTALLATLGKSREALRAAVVHVLFNVVGVLIWLAFIDNLAAFAVEISPMASDLSGIAKLAAETPRQIANANTLFNIANTLIFIGFVPLLAQLVVKLVPDKPEPPGRVRPEPKFLDQELLSTPSLALENVRFELGHMGEQVQDMLAKIKSALITRDTALLEEVRSQLDDVTYLRDQISTYLRAIGQGGLTDEEISKHAKLVTAALNMESMAEVMGRDMVESGLRVHETSLEASDQTREHLVGLYDILTETVADACTAVKTDDTALAQTIINQEPEVAKQADAAFAHLASRLTVLEPERITLHRFELDFIDKMRRIYLLAKSLAELCLERDAA